MSQELFGWCIDAETDDFYLKAQNIWYIRLSDLDDESKFLRLYPFRDGYKKCAEQLKEWIRSYPEGAHVVGFNQLGFDLWIFWRMLGIVPRVGKNGQDYLDDYPVQFVDGYILSMYLNPDSQFHSLDFLSNSDKSSFQEEEGKIDYRKSLIDCGALPKDAPKGAEFKFYHDLLVPYCDRDVAATIKVVKRLWAQAQQMYKKSWLHPSFRQMQKDYWLYSAQAYTGVKFNKKKAEALVKHIEEQMEIIRKEVEPKLPPRPLKTAEQAYYKMPAKPFKKNGDVSTLFSNWLEKHSAVFDDISKEITAYGKTIKLAPNEIFPIELPMEIDDNTELKDWFIEQGWEAAEDFWNFKKGPDGKNIRDDKGKFIKTTPKIQHQGNICPNLLKLEGDIPKKVVKFLSYRNRLGIVKGWLSNWRIEFDGRISAEISGYAPTSRVKHKTVCNVPKADIKVLLGSEMRDLFTVDEGYWYGGTDAAALENRTLSHHTYKYDDGKFARMQTEGDPHSFNAFAFFPALHEQFDITNQENKENPLFKPWRNKAKTGAYLLAFGGGAAKLASSLGLSKAEGQEAYDNYWLMNEGLGKLKAAVEAYFSSTGKNKHIPAIDGRIVSVRGKNVLLSCLGQGTGAIAMSYAACFMDSWLGDMHLDDMGRPYYLYRGYVVKRISMVHDEYSWEIEDGIQEKIKQLSEKAIICAGQALKLSLPLGAEGKLSFEGSWRDVH
jgi:hypothetical protein